jgi:DNA uptake protein ComE-like DNA-binding protein
MKTSVIMFVSLFGSMASAREAGRLATATMVSSTGVEQPQLRAVGRLNVNTASRTQLLKVPGLEPAAIEAILEARVVAPIADLAHVTPLPEEVAAHLKVDGDSNFYRVLQLPLQHLDASRSVTLR